MSERDKPSVQLLGSVFSSCKFSKSSCNTILTTRKRGHFRRPMRPECLSTLGFLTKFCLIPDSIGHGKFEGDRQARFASQMASGSESTRANKPGVRLARRSANH